MRQFSCVSLLLLLGVLLAALHPSVAARRRELLAAATGDQGLGQARAESILTDVDEETTTRGRRRVDERLNYRRFRTRKNNPSSSHAHFGGRIPFTSDYGRVKRHPPKHN